MGEKKIKWHTFWATLNTFKGIPEKVKEGKKMAKTNMGECKGYNRVVKTRRYFHKYCDSIEKKKTARVLDHPEHVQKFNFSYSHSSGSVPTKHSTVFIVFPHRLPSTD